MYMTIQNTSGTWTIEKEQDKGFSLGPFLSEADAFFVTEMMNKGLLAVNMEGLDVKENTQDENAIH